MEKYTLDEVYEAARYAAVGEKYSLTGFNCNHWVEEVGKLLGWGKLNVSAICNCS